MERLDGFHPPYGGERRQEEVVEVTQLVGAICEDGKAIVAVADRMVTSSAFRYEPGMSKGYMLTDTAFVMMAGGTETASAIAQAAYAAVTQKQEKYVAAMAREVALAFRAQREREVVERYLSKYGIRSLQHWHEVQGQLREDLAQSIAAQIAMHKVGVELMVGGVDTAGAKLYVTADRAESQPYTRTGYCCVGSGSVHAATTLARCKYDSTFGLNEALYVAYEAKKRAELAPGVGPETDIFVIDAGGLRIPDRDARLDLKGIYCGQVDETPRETVRDLVGTWRPKLVAPSAPEPETTQPTEERPASSTDHERPPAKGGVDDDQRSTQTDQREGERKG